MALKIPFLLLREEPILIKELQQNDVIYVLIIFSKSEKNILLNVDLIYLMIYLISLDVSIIITTSSVVCQEKATWFLRYL